MGTRVFLSLSPLRRLPTRRVLMCDINVHGSCIRPGNPPGDSRKVTTTCEPLLRNLQHALVSGDKRALIVQEADGTFVTEVSVAPRWASAALQAPTDGRIEKRKPKPRGEQWMSFSID